MKTLLLILATAIFTFSQEPDSLKPHIDGISEVISQKKCSKLEITAEKIYEMAKLIVVEATKYDRIPHTLLAAVIMKESRYDHKKQSPTGPKGLGQLTKSTTKFGCENLGIEYTDSTVFDVKTNIRLTAWYLDYCISKEKGDIELGLARYNGGPREAWRFKCWRLLTGKGKIKISSELELIGALKLRKETKEYVPTVLKYERKITKISEEVALVSIDGY